MSKSRHILQLSPNLRTLNCYNCCARHTKVGQRQQQNSSQCKPVYSLACYVTQTYDVWIFSKRSRVHVMITYVALCTSNKQSTDLCTVHSQYTLYVQGYNFAHYNTLTYTQYAASDASVRQTAGNSSCVPYNEVMNKHNIFGSIQKT